MTAAEPEERLLATLNAYFEAVADAVADAGGEVLKFIGDGVLAVFPVGGADDPAAACRGALAAVRRARGALGRLPAPPSFTAVLHVGPVAYGNVGARERLDFTVIGAAVNVASRVEAVAKALGEPTVVTAAVGRAPAGGRARPRAPRAQGLGRAGGPRRPQPD
jgi:adenylate cyclase